MDLSAVETFLAVMRSGSISRAAEELHLAQSSISHRLKRLEQELNMTLIDRGKGLKEIHLTPAGEEFATLAEKWIALQRETQLLQASGPKVVLSIGTTDSLNTFYFPPLYRAINQHQPPIRLIIRSQHSVELYSEVERRQIDVAIVLRETTLPNLNVERCFASPMVVVKLKTAEDPDATGVVHPADLDPNFELHLAWSSPYFQAWHDKWWNPLHPSRISLDCANVILQLMRDPRHWTIVPMWVAEDAFRRGNYVIRRLSPAPPSMPVYKVTHKYPRPSTVSALAIFDRYFQLLKHNWLSDSL
jgi:DNA-binding transcriptional LysR family regulator